MAEKIILIDDDPEDIEIMLEADQIYKSGLRLLRIYNTDIAVAHINNNGIDRPDFIILDLNMPKMSGLELLIEFRKTASLDKVTIVIHSSAIADPQLTRTLTELRAGFFQKPSNLKSLCSILSNILDKKGTA